METLSVIRRCHFCEEIPIQEIERRTRLSRNMIRKYIRAEAVKPKFKAPDQPSKTVAQQARHCVGVSALAPRDAARCPDPGIPRSGQDSAPGHRRALGGALFIRAQLAPERVLNLASGASIEVAGGVDDGGRGHALGHRGGGHAGISSSWSAVGRGYDLQLASRQ
jgi:hypothetical protein